MFKIQLSVFKRTVHRLSTNQTSLFNAKEETGDKFHIDDASVRKTEMHRVINYGNPLEKNVAVFRQMQTRSHGAPTTED